jgi:hypothetical protein
MVTVGSDAVQNYSFNIAGTGTDPLSISHTTPATLSSIFDFTISTASGAQTVKAGASATYMLNVAPTGTGNTFPTNVAFSCSGLPLLSTCSFTTVATGSGATTATLTISTTAPSAASHAGTSNLFYALMLPLPTLVIVLGGVRRRSLHRWTRLTPLLIATALLGSLVACGGGGSNGGTGGAGLPGTPVGTYTVMVSASSGSAPTKTVNVTLTVQ